MNIQLLNKAQKAKELNITTRTLDRWVAKGKINPIYISTSKRRWFMPEVLGNVYCPECKEKLSEMPMGDQHGEDFDNVAVCNNCGYMEY